MATRTWSWEHDDLDNDINAGNSWLSYSLSADSTALPSNAIVSKVEYRILMRIGNITTKSDSVFRLYGIGVYNGPYTGASYSNSSPSTVYGTVPAATSVKTSNTETRPSSGNYNSGSFQNGNYYVWNYNDQRTYCEITGCDFVNINNVSAFNSSLINMRIKMNTNFGGTSYVMQASVTVTYETASLTTPGAPIIVQHETNGTFSANWNASTGSNGSGAVSYVLYRDDSVWVSAASTNSLSGLTIPDYDDSHNFYVVASYSGVTKQSSITSVQFEPPDIKGPTSISISPLTGSSVTVSWPPATLYWTAGTIVYRLWYKLNSTSAGWVQYSINDTNLCSITIDDTWFEQNAAEGDKFYFQVDAWASNITNNATGDYEQISSGSPLANQPFTYDGKRTVAYYNGSKWEECTIHYYDGSKWQECIPYYYDGTNWVELKFNE